MHGRTRLTIAKEGIMNEEVVQDSVEEEIAPQEYQEDDSTQAVEESETEVDAQAEEQARKAEEQERNWRAMRQQQKEKDLAIQQRDEKIATMEALLTRLVPKQDSAKEPEEEQFDLDEYANYNGVQKLTKKNMQPLEQKIQHLESLLNKQEEEKKINAFKAKYPDFDDVVNVETLELLEKKEPELAFSILELKDPFKMGLQSYKYIKALGLEAELPNARRVKEIDKKIEKNSKAVQSPQAYDKRPMAKAFKATASDQKRLYEEMMHYASQAQGL